MPSWLPSARDRHHAAGSRHARRARRERRGAGWGAAFPREGKERLVVVPETGEIAWEAVGLDLPQKDPFDRIILAIARLLRLQWVTRDREIAPSARVPVGW